MDGIKKWAWTPIDRSSSLANQRANFEYLWFETYDLPEESDNGASLRETACLPMKNLDMAWQRDENL